MPSRTTRRRPAALIALTAAIVFSFALTSQAGAGTAQTSDASSAYATAIAKAKQKRTAKLKNCNKKPKANRAACRKAANNAFQTAKEKAQQKRDAANDPDPGGPSGSPAEEYRDCVAGGGDPGKCKEEAKDPKGSR